MDPAGVFNDVNQADSSLDIVWISHPKHHAIPMSRHLVTLWEQRTYKPRGSKPLGYFMGTTHLQTTWFQCVQPGFNGDVTSLVSRLVGEHQCRSQRHLEGITSIRESKYLDPLAMFTYRNIQLIIILFDPIRHI
jgi:hypothetical protein